jgi:periplasmic protein TonB
VAKGVALAGWQAHATLWGALAALIVHASVAVGLSAWVLRGGPARPPTMLEIEVNEPKPIVPEPPPPEPRIEPPTPTPRPIVRRALPKPEALPPPNRETPLAAPDLPPAAPVFGVTPESVTQGESAVAVPVGNTLMTKDRTPAKGPVAPLPAAPDPNAFAPVEDNLIAQHAAVLSEVVADYPPEAKRLGIEGRVILRVAIDRKGNVRWTKVIRSAGHGMDEAAMQALAKSRFRPARTVDGRLVDQVITWKYDFQSER